MVNWFKSLHLTGLPNFKSMKSILICISIFCCFFSYSQSEILKSYGISSGFKSTASFAIFADSRGFIWAGTSAEGVVKGSQLLTGKISRIMELKKKKFVSQILVNWNIFQTLYLRWIQWIMVKKIIENGYWDLYQTTWKASNPIFMN